MNARRVGPVLAALALVAVAQPGRALAQERFVHEDHGSIACADCHANGRATSSANTAWCASCHHVEASVAECERCHDTADLLPAPGRTLVTFHLSVLGLLRDQCCEPCSIHTALVWQCTHDQRTY